MSGPFEVQIVELEGVRVGMTHGHMIMPRGNDMALDAERRRLNVDVLLSASTGRASTKQHGSGLLVDPGSITGLPCSPMASGRPSFTLLSLDNGKVSPSAQQLSADSTQQGSVEIASAGMPACTVISTENLAAVAAMPSS